MAAVTIKNDFGAQENKVCQCFQFFTTKAFDCVDHSKLKNSERDGNTRPPYLSSETCLWVKNQQLEPDIEQLTGSKLGKE